jgi:hypothetical protein
VKTLKGRGDLRSLGLDKRKILKRILNKYDERTWTGFIWLRTASNGGAL